MRVLSKGPGQTRAIGARIARRLKKGDCVALIGELGAGKTMLVKGIARGLGLRDVRYVNSPSFVIVKEYRGRLPLYHFDIYRLDVPAAKAAAAPTALDGIGYDEYCYGDGVTVIEWADKIKAFLPKGHIAVRIAITGPEERLIEVAAPRARGAGKRKKARRKT